MSNTDDPVIARLETRLARLAQAREALDIVRMRLKQVEHRAPQLKTIVRGGLDNLNEALAGIEREFEQTREERNNGNKERSQIKSR